jgi:hypothetical protein
VDPKNRSPSLYDVLSVVSALQDIKDLMRKAGEVTFADISRDNDSQG